MGINQIDYYRAKLANEMDSADLREAIEENKRIVVVDGRSANAYANEHIPGAISLPHREITSESTKSLDKSSIYVCYCDGIGCNASTKTALKLLRLGFQVRELIGGLDWWKRDGYATHGETVCTEIDVKCAC